MTRIAKLAGLAAAPMVLMAAACAEETVTASVATTAATAAVEETANPLSVLSSGEYALDPAHSSLIWKVNHLGLANYVARFTNFEATVSFDSDSVTDSTVNVTVDANSVETDYPFPERADFDAKLRGEDWLNTEANAQITFTSTSLEQTGPTTGKLTGDLTFYGVTKPVTLDVEFTGGLAEHPFAKKPAFGIAAKGKIDRTDWGFDTYVPNIGADVHLMINAEFIKQ